MQMITGRRANSDARPPRPGSRPARPGDRSKASTVGPGRCRRDSDVLTLHFPCCPAGSIHPSSFTLPRRRERSPGKRHHDSLGDSDVRQPPRIQCPGQCSDPSHDTVIAACGPRPRPGSESGADRHWHVPLKCRRGRHNNTRSHLPSRVLPVWCLALPHGSIFQCMV
jgi:hypothetical protein